MNVSVQIDIILEISWTQKYLQFGMKIEVEPPSETPCFLQYMKYTSHTLGNNQRNMYFS